MAASGRISMTANNGEILARARLALKPQNVLGAVNAGYTSSAEGTSAVTRRVHDRPRAARFVAGSATAPPPHGHIKESAGTPQTPPPPSRSGPPSPPTPAPWTP